MWQLVQWICQLFLVQPAPGIELFDLAFHGVASIDKLENEVWIVGLVTFRPVDVAIGLAGSSAVSCPINP